MKWIKFDKESKCIRKIRYSKVYGKCWKFYSYLRWFYYYYKNTYYNRFRYWYLKWRIFYISMKIRYKIILIQYYSFRKTISLFRAPKFFITVKENFVWFYEKYVFWFIYEKLYNYIILLFKYIIILYTWPYLLTVHFHIWFFSKIYFYIFRHSFVNTRLFKYFKNHNSLLLKQVIALPVMIYISNYNYKSWAFNLFWFFNKTIAILVVYFNYLSKLIILYWYEYDIIYKIALRSKRLFCFLYDYAEYKRFLQRFFFVKYFFVPILMVYLYIIAYLWNPIQIVRYFYFRKYCRSVKSKYKSKWIIIKFEIIDLWLDILIKYIPSVLKWFDYFIDKSFKFTLKCADKYYGKEVFGKYIFEKDKRWMHSISPEIIDVVLETDYNEVILKAKYQYFVDSWLLSKIFFKKDYDELFCTDYMYEVQKILNCIAGDIKFMFKVFDWFCKGKVNLFIFKLVYMIIYYRIHDEYNNEIYLYNIVKNEKIFFYWLEAQKRKYLNKSLIKFINESSNKNKILYKINNFMYILFCILPIQLLMYIGFINPFTIFKIGYFLTDTKRKLRSINFYYSTYIKLLLLEFYFFRKFFNFIKLIILWKRRIFSKNHRNYYFNKRINEIKFNLFLFTENKNLTFFSACLDFIINNNNFFIRLIFFFFKSIYIYISIIIIIFIFYLNSCLGISVYIPELIHDLFFISRLIFLNLTNLLYDILIYLIHALHVEAWRPSLWYFYDPIGFFGFDKWFDSIVNYEYISMKCTVYIYNMYRCIYIYIIYTIILYINNFIIFFFKFLVELIKYINTYIYDNTLFFFDISVWLHTLLECEIILNNHWFITVSMYENDTNWKVLDQVIFYVPLKNSEFLKSYLLILYNYNLLNNYNIINILMLIIDNIIIYLFKLILFNINMFSYLFFNIFPTIITNIFSMLCTDGYYILYNNNYLNIKLYFLNLLILDNYFYINITILLNELELLYKTILNWFFIFIIDKPIEINLLTNSCDKLVIYYINFLINLYEIYVYFSSLVFFIYYVIIDIILFIYKILIIIIFNKFENDVLDIFVNYYLLYIYNEFYYNLTIKWYLDKIYLLLLYIDSLIDYIIISIILELYIWFVGIPYFLTMYVYSTFMMYFYKIVMFITEPYIRFMLHTIDEFIIYLAILKHVLTIDLLYWYRDFVYRVYLYAYNIIYILPIIIWISLIVKLVYGILYIIKGITLYTVYSMFKLISILIIFVLKYVVFLLNTVFFYINIPILIELNKILIEFKLTYLLFLEWIDILGVIFIHTYMYVFDKIFFILFDLDYATNLIFEYITDIYLRLNYYNYWNRIIDAIFNINIYNSMIYYYLVLHYLWLVRVSWRRLEKIMFPERFIVKIDDEELCIEALWNKYKYEVVGKNKKALPLSFNEYCFFYTIDLVKFLSKNLTHPLSQRLSTEPFFLNEFSFSINPYSEIEKNDELNFIQIWVRRIIGKCYMFRYNFKKKINFFFENYFTNKVFNANYIFFKNKTKFAIVYYYNSYKLFKFTLVNFNYKTINIKCINTLLKSNFNFYLNSFFLLKNNIINSVFDLVDNNIDKFTNWYKNFYWEYVFNFELKLNSILYKYNRFVHSFKQDYLCISYKTKYKGKDFYKKEDFISYTVQLEQSILNRGILVGNIYKYKSVKEKIIRTLKNKDRSDIYWINTHEVYLNEAKLKFLGGYESTSFWSADLGIAIIEAYGQYKKYILYIIQFPIMPDLTGFAVHVSDNDILLSFEKSSLRRNHHFNEFFKELEKGTTKLSIFKNTRFLFKDFNRMGVYSMTSIPHLNISNILEKTISNETIEFSTEMSAKLTRLSVSYKNFFLDNSNLVDDSRPMNMSRYLVGTAGNFVLTQIEDQYSRYLNGTVFYEPWVKYIKWKDSFLEYKKFRPFDLNTVKYLDNIYFNKFIFNFPSKRSAKELLVSIIVSLPIYNIYISYYFNTFIYEFFSFIHLFRFELMVDFIDGFVKLANLTFNRRLHLRGLVERDLLSMYNVGREVYKYLNGSFTEIEKQSTSSFIFNKKKYKRKLFKFGSQNINNNYYNFFFNDNFNYKINNNDEYISINKKFENFNERNFYLKYNYINFIEKYSILNEKENGFDDNFLIKKKKFNNLNVELFFYLNDIKLLILQDNCGYSIKWLSSILYDILDLSFLYLDEYKISDNLFVKYSLNDVYMLLISQSFYDSLLNYNKYCFFFKNMFFYKSDIYEDEIIDSEFDDYISYSKDLYANYITRYTLNQIKIINWYMDNFVPEHVFNNVYMFYFSYLNSSDESYFLFLDFLKFHYAEYVYWPMSKVNSININYCFINLF